VTKKQKLLVVFGISAIGGLVYWWFSRRQGAVNAPTPVQSKIVFSPSAATASRPPYVATATSNLPLIVLNNPDIYEVGATEIHGLIGANRNERWVLKNGSWVSA
jgi:hypothetical protein